MSASSKMGVCPVRFTHVSTLKHVVAAPFTMRSSNSASLDESVSTGAHRPALHVSSDLQFVLSKHENESGIGKKRIFSGVYVCRDERKMRPFAASVPSWMGVFTQSANWSTVVASWRSSE
ncbi:MAG: hypothetical protein IPK71_11690 [Myxococcales bacterium]|nr:hypothetical protein [Myxococcales bacterium]